MKHKLLEYLNTEFKTIQPSISHLRNNSFSHALNDKVEMIKAFKPKDLKKFNTILLNQVKDRNSSMEYFKILERSTSPEAKVSRVNTKNNFEKIDKQLKTSIYFIKKQQNEHQVQNLRMLKQTKKDKRYSKRVKLQYEPTENDSNEFEQKITNFTAKSVLITNNDKLSYKLGRSLKSASSSKMNISSQNEFKCRLGKRSSSKEGKTSHKLNKFIRSEYLKLDSHTESQNAQNDQIVTTTSLSNLEKIKKIKEDLKSLGASENSRLVENHSLSYIRTLNQNPQKKPRSRINYADLCMDAKYVVPEKPIMCASNDKFNRKSKMIQLMLNKPF